MPKRILIIDDERDMQIYLATLFRKAGYEPLLASDGEQGLAQAQELRPVLITLDVLMPRQSGVSAYQALRTTAATQGIPVIVVTGLAQHEKLFADELKGLPPPDAVVDKPINREELLAKVGELVGES